MELWQLDVVHGFLLADGTTAKALTGIDDHSRFCVSARLMTREPTQAVCDGFSSALRTYGLPSQVLTDNGKVFTGRFAQPPVDLLGLDTRSGSRLVALQVSACGVYVVLRPPVRVKREPDTCCSQSDRNPGRGFQETRQSSSH